MVEAQAKIVSPPKPVPASVGNNLFLDSGYHGSQATAAFESQEATQLFTQSWSPTRTPAKANLPSAMNVQSEERRTTEGSFQSAKEDQTFQMIAEKAAINTSPAQSPMRHMESYVESPAQTHTSQPASPQNGSPERIEVASVEEDVLAQQVPESESKAIEVFDEAETPSDGSSPVRQLVRKSSLSFASLPAREPLTTKKSIGNRTSRTSHLEQNRTSYYGRNNDSKSFGDQIGNDTDEDEMDVDTIEPAVEPASNMTQTQNKTYTQRLQDQISMLGQSKPNAPRPSKSISNIAAMASQAAYPVLPQEPRPATSPSRTERSFVAPGAFPDDEDSWIGPPNLGAPDAAPNLFSPKPALTKAYSTEVMEDIRGKDSIGGHELSMPKLRGQHPQSPLRGATVLERPTIFGHAKSSSTSVIRSPNKNSEMLNTTLSVSNPNILGQDDSCEQLRPKSSLRGYRDSPLRVAKDKLSSILKTSKGLFASSAATSAGAMASTLSSPPPRPTYHDSPSMGDAMEGQSTTPSLYPSLKAQLSSQSLLPESPSKQASIRKAQEKEARDAQIMVQQLNKLDREREKEAEKARVFSQQERERVAAMERKVAAQKEDQRRVAAQKEEERRTAIQREEERRVAAQKDEERRTAIQREEERRVAAQKEEAERKTAIQQEERLAAIQKEEERKTLASQASASRVTRNSPRRTKAQLEAEGRAAAAAAASAAEDVEENVEMTSSTTMAPSLSRSQIGRPKEIKRPLRPTTKQPTANTRGAPVVIRVNTGSRPFQPSNASLAASLGDSLPPPNPQPAAGPSRARQPARGLQTKASNDNLRSASTTTKVRALEAAARKKEQDEREAQRKRDAKIELANQLDAKRTAQTAQRALEKKQELEKAKLNRPPPPPARPNPNSDRDKPLPAAPRAELEQPHRMTLTQQRPQDESRTNTLQNTTKAPPKRPLANDDAQSRQMMQRNGLSYQQNDSKRRKTEDEFEEDFMESQPRGAMAPPIRQSSIRQKVCDKFELIQAKLTNLQDAPTKSLFPSGYSNASSSHNTVHNAPHAAPQHMASKPTRPMDMTQTSKAAINFAPNPAHKTPARPMGPGNPNGKSTSKPPTAAKSSPRYVNGESIDLPEIPTDSEDEDSDGGADFAVPDWANSPNLAAGIMAQEGKDPVSVFGPPGELNMEEVFRNKERWGRFRQRTSSANWSGTDRLTEEEIQRDLVARERLRKEGGWTYGMS